jgi:hypothetical protein
MLMPERVSLLPRANPSFLQIHWKIVANKETEPSREGPVNRFEGAPTNFLYISNKFFRVSLVIFNGKIGSLSLTLLLLLIHRMIINISFIMKASSSNAIRKKVWKSMGLFTSCWKRRP